MARMYGKLGWYGQCKCCDGNADKGTVRAREESQWRMEAEEELNDGEDVRQGWTLELV
jgi:hypothetical protein